MKPSPPSTRLTAARLSTLSATLSAALFATVCATATGANAIETVAADALNEPAIEISSGEFKTPVVELYTSEGCSSCPPADDWLRKLGASLERDFNAVLLAFHVDYWNYLGWPDPYSKPEFTDRQRFAAANHRRRTIYTPAFLVDGREARAGRRIVRAIENANAQPAQADIEARVVRRGNGVDNGDDHGDDHGDNNSGGDVIRARIEVDNNAPNAAHYQMHVAVYESGITRRIGGGENRGRTLKHDFVVRHWSAPIVIRRGLNHAEVDVDIPADWRRPNLGLAVVIQNRRTFETLQAVSASLAELFSG